MTRIDVLRKNYQRICALPWDRNIAGPQRVWAAIYDKEDERKLRLRIGLFEEATQQAGRRWYALDFTNAFADWLCNTPYSGYAASYFEAPARLGTGPLDGFRKAVAGRLTAALQGVDHGEESVVAVYGVASLFGFVQVSEVLPLVEPHIQGRLLVFFPGVYDQSNYRLLDARDGWNYHAVPITASEGEVGR